MAEELNELRAAIQHELELARSGDGYEEAAVAEEIVERIVAPMLEKSVMEEALRWRKIVEQWEQGHQNEVLPYTAKLEAEAEHERANQGMLLWLHAEAVWRLASERQQRWDHVLNLLNDVQHAEEENDQLRRERKRLEASRQAWAEEAMTVQCRYEDLLGAIWLYVNWHYVTKQLTTEQKNLWADAVDASGDPDDLGPKADRWWAELPCGHTVAEAQRSIRHELCDTGPQCAVHPETRGEGEERSGRDDTGQASREEAAEQTVGTGYPQGSGPGRGSATPAPLSSRHSSVHPDGETA